MNIILPIPHRMPIRCLEDALKAANLPAAINVRKTGPLAMRVTPGPGTDRQALEAFVKGFIAGFNA